MNVTLHVDGQKVKLNRFTNKIFGSIIEGAVKSLRDIEEDWKEIRLEVVKSNKD